jgi:eukaryotic-like serine/threonine-protein kinase
MDAEPIVLAGRYRLLSKLGQGGMGSVHEAEDLTLGSRVAVKLIDPVAALDPQACERFRREARAAAAIRSTHVVQVLDFGIDDGRPYIAMELLKGESLRDRLSRSVRFEPAQTLELLTQVGRALSLAHESNIVHRDIKPDNIFVVREGDQDVVKVLDFGIAHVEPGFADGEGLKTATGALLGTPFYMSPEQARGRSVDHRTDIWSFALIACECLVGRRPYQADSISELLHAICYETPPLPSELGPVPAGFDAWFARAAARKRDDRYASIVQAVEELRRVLGGGAGGDLATIVAESPSELEVTAPPSATTLPGGSSRQSRRSPVVLGGVGIVVVALVAGGYGVYALMARSAPAPAPRATTERGGRAAESPVQRGLSAGSATAQPVTVEPARAATASLPESTPDAQPAPSRSAVAAPASAARSTPAKSPTATTPSPAKKPPRPSVPRPRENVAGF